MATKLAEKQSKLTDAAIKTKLENLSGWALENGELARNFELADFSAALSFVNTVGYFAQVAEHHPDITINYNKVKLALVSHDAGGITDKDFALAQQIDKLPMPKSK